MLVCMCSALASSATVGTFPVVLIRAPKLAKYLEMFLMKPLACEYKLEGFFLAVLSQLADVAAPVCD